MKRPKPLLFLRPALAAASTCFLVLPILPRLSLSSPLLVVIGACLLLVSVNTKPALEYVDDQKVVSQQNTGNLCPDFKEPSIEEYEEGWTVYSRPDECYSLAYPEGWGVKDSERNTSIRREDELETETYTTENAYAFVGVNLLAEHDTAFREKVERTLQSEDQFCMDVGFAAIPATECYMKGKLGNTFLVSYRTDFKKNDLSIVEDIVSTIMLW